MNLQFADCVCVHLKEVVALIEYCLIISRSGCSSISGQIPTFSSSRIDRSCMNAQDFELSSAPSFGPIAFFQILFINSSDQL